jgi:hypothetical protein
LGGSVFQGACRDLEEILFLIPQIASSAFGGFCYMGSICLGDTENLAGENWKGQNCFPGFLKCLKMASHKRSSTLDSFTSNLQNTMQVPIGLPSQMHRPQKLPPSQAGKEDIV